MPASRSAMLIASPIPRVPPVTIATRAICLSCLSPSARLRFDGPACKFTADQRLQHGHAFGRIVEAIEPRKGLAADCHERLAPANSKFLDGLDAVGREARRGD